MSESIFYVYQYLDEEGNPYYIGKGSKDRINESHLPWVQIPTLDRRRFIQTDLSEKIRQANLGRKRDICYEKVGLAMSMKRWYTNGEITKMFVPDRVPDGFRPGRNGWSNKGAK